MKSDNFKIQGGNFNMTSGSKSSSNYSLADVVGETAAGIFASKGYVINGGFLSSAAATYLSLSVTPSLIDFGSLYPNLPEEKSIYIKVKTGDTVGFTVRTIENYPLKTAFQAVIPDTHCDENINPCLINRSAPWLKNVSYGFGYRMAGSAIVAGFENASHYRSFPALSRNEGAVPIMQQSGKKITAEAVMTVRLNIGPNQPVGDYSNSISFSALSGI